MRILTACPSFLARTMWRRERRTRGGMVGLSEGELKGQRRGLIRGRRAACLNPPRGTPLIPGRVFLGGQRAGGRHHLPKAVLRLHLSCRKRCQQPLFDSFLVYQPDSLTQGYGDDAPTLPQRLGCFRQRIRKHVEADAYTGPQKVRYAFVERSWRVTKEDQNIGIAHGCGLPASQGAEKHDRQHRRVLRQLAGIGVDISLNPLTIQPEESDAHSRLQSPRRWPPPGRRRRGCSIGKAGQMDGR